MVFFHLIWVFFTPEHVISILPHGHNNGNIGQAGDNDNYNTCTYFSNAILMIMMILSMMEEGLNQNVVLYGICRRIFVEKLHSTFI